MDSVSGSHFVQFDSLIATFNKVKAPIAKHLSNIFYSKNVRQFIVRLHSNRLSQV